MKEHIPGTAEHRATHPHQGAGMTGQVRLSVPGCERLHAHSRLAASSLCARCLGQGCRVVWRGLAGRRVCCQQRKCGTASNRPPLLPAILPQVKSHVPGTAEHAATHGAGAGYAGAGTGAVAGERYGEGYEKTAYP